MSAPGSPLVGAKNFRWLEDGRDDKGQARFRPEHVPLQDGQAQLPQFVSRLPELKYDGVVSIHSECRGRDGRELLDQAGKDLAYLKTLL